jgi:hypothetical protein
VRKNILAIVFLGFCTLLVAQQALNNDAVIKLVKAGLSEDLIVTTISAQAGAYDTSADGLIALKTSGVSDRVVAAIVAKAAEAAQPVQPPVPPLPPMPAQAPAAANPDDPAAPHDAGIYVFSDAAPAGSKMEMLEPSVYSQGKMGGMFVTGLTYGIAKTKFKAVIRGAHANVRVADPNAVFYFYFERQGEGLSNAQSFFGGTSTPNEYTLLRFDVKKDSRETTTGSFNAYGASGGTDDKAMVAFTYTKLRPGAYKVTLNAPLMTGEYGFVSPSGIASGPYMTGANGTSRVFDFGAN